MRFFKIRWSGNATVSGWGAICLEMSAMPSLSNCWLRLIIPVIALVLGVVLRDERPTALSYVGAVLVMIGSFFRGPGFNFTLPWRDGLFFEL